MAENGGYKLVQSTEVYRNPWIVVREDKVERPGGGALFGVVEMKAGASVLALTDAGQALLVREYKYAAARETLEVISGAIEPGETPLEAAKRELREEGGAEAREWIDLGVIDPFTTVVHSPNFIFLAKGLTPADRDPDEGEYVEPVSLPFERVLAMALASEITHGASVVAILKAARLLGR